MRLAFAHCVRCFSSAKLTRQLRFCTNRICPGGHIWILPSIFLSLALSTLSFTKHKCGTSAPGYTYDDVYKHRSAHAAMYIEKRYGCAAEKERTTPSMSRTANIARATTFAHIMHNCEPLQSSFAQICSISTNFCNYRAKTADRNSPLICFA